MYEKVDSLFGTKTIGELLEHHDDEVFFYGQSEEDSEAALRDLIIDGFKEQAEGYEKYYFDGIYVICN